VTAHAPECRRQRENSTLAIAMFCNLNSHKNIYTKSLTSFVVHPASYSMGTGVLCRDKAAAVWYWPLTQNRGLEWLKLYLHFSNMPSWRGHPQIHLYLLQMGYAVAQLVEALCYKPEGRGFDSRWCHYNVSLT
jgi:hypothetical protein